MLTAALVSGPAHGTVTLSPAGGFSYLPFPGFTGTDTFTYRALNEAGTGTTATVSIAVQQPTVVQAPVGLYAWSIAGNGVTLALDATLDRTGAHGLCARRRRSAR